MRVVFLLFAVSLGCSGPPAPSAAGPSAPKAELTLEGVRLRVYRDSEPQLTARAAHVELMRTTGALAADHVEGEFLSEQLSFQTPRLLGNVNTLAFDGSQGVQLGSTGREAGHRLIANTVAAHFEAKEGARGVVSGSQPVEVRGEQHSRPFSLSASKFRFDVAEQHATFEPVTSKVGAQ